MISMSPGAKLDASSGPEKGQLPYVSGLSRLRCQRSIKAEPPMQFKHMAFHRSAEDERRFGIAMKDWNIVVTVNDGESFRKARQKSNASATASRRTTGTSWFSVCPMSRSSEVDFDQALQSIHRLACSIHKLLESARCHRPLALALQLSGML